jgi:hypothetical protein
MDPLMPAGAARLRKYRALTGTSSNATYFLERAPIGAARPGRGVEVASELV